MDVPTCEAVSREISGELPLPDDAALQGAARVLQGQYTDQRASQCDVGSVGSSTHWYCPICALLIPYAVAPFWSPCHGHSGPGGCGVSAGELQGLRLYPDFIDPTYEAELVTFLDEGCADRFEGWKVSQSGKRKQDYGPQPNFKKKRVKLREDLLGIPREMQKLTFAVQGVLTGENPPDPFVVAQISALEYVPEAKSFLNPHIDDTWLWGDRVVGVSLLSDCRMTFVTKSLSVVDVPLPRRAMFVLSGPARYDALHGIRTENIMSRRLSITIRELSKSWVEAADLSSLLEIRGLFDKWI